ncbi:MAG: hypothetical protein ACPIB2_02015 [Flavobacteriaceae bacterium]
MKNLRHTPNFFQYTEMTLALLAIGNKGSVGSKTKRLSSLPSLDLRAYDR